MTPDSFDPKTLYDGLVAHGLIVPTAQPGTFGRGAVFEDVLERFNGLVSKLSAHDGAEVYTFPPVIDRGILEKVHYMDSFPHLCGSVHSFFGNGLEALRLAERVNSGEPWGDLLGQTGVTLNPAACYPVYPTFTGTVPAEGRLVTMLNWVYRHEPSHEPTRMQSFRVREYVRVGTPDQVVSWRDMWLERGVKLLTSLGLPAKPDVASDPFFGRGGKMLAESQKQAKLKFEVLVPVISEENPTAVCSFNFHQTHFGDTFDIKTPDGNAANTACLGFGLERVTMALFKHHGFKPENWPAEVRQQLWS
ncbi:MAG: amino acid--[acyl-carrier-protein] ligase [Burkholderiales bacterium]|jgi:seryl-tRNA synthetase|nr:MAG: amino acid--[acyl-carrier-protein] ligase [Burkholderiales bacterium]